ncbi:MAG: hypothetical protein ACLTW9_28765 [Enterocloster sp.]
MVGLKKWRYLVCQPGKCWKPYPGGNSGGMTEGRIPKEEERIWQVNELEDLAAEMTGKRGWLVLFPSGTQGAIHLLFWLIARKARPKEGDGR